MRTIDLALFADALAAEAATLSARLERARRRLRQAAIEHEARLDLPPDVVTVLQRRGLIPASGSPSPEEETADIGALRGELDAVECLQAWVERRLAEAQREIDPGGRTRREEAMSERT